jgi:hypothetical protein
LTGPLSTARSRRRRSPRGDRRRVFLAVTLADVVACKTLTAVGLAQGVWLLNLPATITLGRLAAIVGGDAAALAVTIPTGAAIYGWAGARYYNRQRATAGSH